jgi:hypothetical protein
VPQAGPDGASGAGRAHLGALPPASLPPARCLPCSILWRRECFLKWAVFYLGEGPLTGAARRSGQCRGPALMGPRGPAGPIWGRRPQLRYAAPPPDVGYSKAGPPALDGTVTSARPSGVPSKARGPRGPARPFWGLCPQLRHAALPPRRRCNGISRGVPAGAQPHRQPAGRIPGRAFKNKAPLSFWLEKLKSCCVFAPWPS